MQIGDVFVPYVTFQGDYRAVLSDISEDILTRREKALLLVLNSYSFKDGQCYPSQISIAKKLGCPAYGGNGKSMSDRHVRNLLKSLENKGFLKIDRPSFLDRHLKKKNSTYFFLWNNAYSNDFSAEISGVISSDTPIINKSSISIKTAEADIENKELTGKIEQVSLEIDAAVQAAGIPFNVDRFKSFNLNKYYYYPEETMLKALEGIQKRIETGFNERVDLWAYGTAIINNQGPRLTAQAEVKEAKEFAVALQNLADMLPPGGIFALNGSF